MEHLALMALGGVGVPASRTQVLASADDVFLEVQRFDRIGAAGRVGMLSAGAVDDEFFGQRQSWPPFAAHCAQERYIDRHYENISLLVGDDGEYAGVAQAYDFLPMRYAPLGGGLDPELTPTNPTVGPIGAQPQVWEAAAKAADAFWASVQGHARGADLEANQAAGKGQPGGGQSLRGAVAAHGQVDGVAARASPAPRPFSRF